MRLRVRIALASIAVIAGAVVVLRPVGRGLAFVVRAADMHGFVRRLADLGTRPATERELSIPTPRGALRAHLYSPGPSPRRTVLLVSGLHAAGIEEPRLVALSRQLAVSGLAVVTPDIPELSHFAITPAITDDIEQAAGWLAGGSGLVADGRIGLMGISFSGGLSVI